MCHASRILMLNLPLRYLWASPNTRTPLNSPHVPLQGLSHILSHYLDIYLGKVGLVGMCEYRTFIWGVGFCFFYSKTDQGRSSVLFVGQAAAVHSLQLIYVCAGYNYDKYSVGHLPGRNYTHSFKRRKRKRFSPGEWHPDPALSFVKLPEREVGWHIWL